MPPYATSLAMAAMLCGAAAGLAVAGPTGVTPAANIPLSVHEPLSVKTSQGFAWVLGVGEDLKGAQTYAARSGSAFQATTQGLGNSLHLGAVFLLGTETTWGLTYGLGAPYQSTLVFEDGSTRAVGLLVHSLDLGVTYRVLRWGALDLGFGFSGGGEWPVATDGSAFTSGLGHVAPELWARWPLADRWRVVLRAGAQFSKDFEDNSQTALGNNPNRMFPAGSVDGTGAVGFARLDLEWAWKTRQDGPNP